MRASIYQKQYVALSNEYRALSDDDQRGDKGKALLDQINPLIDKMIDEQSAETDVTKRKAMVTKIEQALLKDGARPPISHGVANTCWAPAVKNLVLQHNSIYNGWRLEDVWLDK